MATIVRDNEICGISLSHFLDDGRGLPLVLLICHDLTWSISLNAYSISSSLIPPAEATIPDKIVTVASLCNVLQLLQSLDLCIGSPDEKFNKTRLFHNGIFKSKDGKFINNNCMSLCITLFNVKDL